MLTGFWSEMLKGDVDQPRRRPEPQREHVIWFAAGICLGHLLCIGAQYMSVPGRLLTLVRGLNP